MLENRKSVAETVSELPVSHRSIERRRKYCFPLFDKPRSSRPRQTCSDSDESVVNVVPLHNFKRIDGRSECFSLDYPAPA